MPEDIIEADDTSEEENHEDKLEKAASKESEIFGEEGIKKEEFAKFLRPVISTAPVLEPVQLVSEKTINLEKGVEDIFVEDKKEDKKTYEIAYENVKNDYENRAINPPSKDFIVPMPHHQVRPSNEFKQREFLKRDDSLLNRINPELQQLRQNTNSSQRDYITNVSGEFKESRTHSPIEQQQREYRTK